MTTSSITRLTLLGFGTVALLAITSNACVQDDPRHGTNTAELAGSVAAGTACQLTCTNVTYDDDGAATFHDYGWQQDGSCGAGSYCNGPEGGCSPCSETHHDTYLCTGVCTASSPPTPPTTPPPTTPPPTTPPPTTPPPTTPPPTTPPPTTPPPTTPPPAGSCTMSCTNTTWLYDEAGDPLGALMHAYGWQDDGGCAVGKHCNGPSGGCAPCSDASHATPSCTGTCTPNSTN